MSNSSSVSRSVTPPPAVSASSSSAHVDNGSGAVVKKKRKVRTEAIGSGGGSASGSRAANATLAANPDLKAQLIERSAVALAPKVDADVSKNDEMTALEKEALDFIKTDLVALIKSVQGKEDLEGMIEDADFQKNLIKLAVAFNEHMEAKGYKGKEPGAIIALTLKDIVEEIKNDETKIDLLGEVPDHEVKEYLETLTMLANLFAGTSISGNVVAPAAAIIVGKALIDRLLPFLPNRGKWMMIGGTSLGVASYIVMAVLNSTEAILDPWMQYIPLFFAVGGILFGLGYDFYKDRNRKASEIPAVAGEIAAARAV